MLPPNTARNSTPGSGSLSPPYMLLTQSPTTLGAKVATLSPRKKPPQTEVMISATRLCAKTSPFSPIALAFSERVWSNCVAKVLTLSETARTWILALALSSALYWSLMLYACVLGTKIAKHRSKVMSKPLLEI